MQEEILKTMGVRIAAFRQSKGIEPAAICRKMDISRKLLTRIENGKSELSASQLVHLARILNVQPSDLIGVGEGRPQ